MLRHSAHHKAKILEKCRRARRHRRRCRADTAFVSCKHYLIVLCLGLLIGDIQWAAQHCCLCLMSVCASAFFHILGEYWIVACVLMTHRRPSIHLAYDFWTDVFVPLHNSTSDIGHLWVFRSNRVLPVACDWATRSIRSHWVDVDASIYMCKFYGESELHFCATHALSRK